MVTLEKEVKPKKLGDVLIEKGIITPFELEKALETQSQLKKPLGEVLVQMGYCTWDDIVRALAEQYGIEACIGEVKIDNEFVKKFPKELIQELKIVPISERDGKLFVGISNVYDIPNVKRRLKFRMNKDVDFCLFSPSVFESMYNTVIHGMSSSVFAEQIGDAIVQQQEEEKTEETEKISEEDTPVVKLVSNIVSHAIELDASDIHIEPQRKNVVVRYRVDGVLRRITEYPRNMHSAVVSRIKILSGLDIVERRLPQDGKFFIKKDEEQFDLRVSTMPSVHGEKVVMRILKVSSSKKKLEDLGYSPYNYERIKKLIEHPYGIILVTGPTGSGKSTTLVAVINSLNSEDVNIVTAEDPVEYTVDGITQCQVNAEIGLTFAKYLRAFLRQDPDIIMVGEIRDKETAQLAVEASLTGHLVLSTLHTNTAAGAIDRLVNMGIEPSLISASLIGVMGQRLVRKVCPYCKVETELPPEYAEKAKKIFPDMKPIQYVGQGCDKCNNTGYKGRTAVAEVLIVNDEIRRLIQKEASTFELDKAARKNGMISMFQDGLYKVLSGETTIAEILSVVGEEEE
ncbi:GspE/PulE family protein [Fervidobacterium nodosum]|uniref:Type II secretion system protein E n=1 Tax=Fervidobacterium nodosum (strain ATCC 35602 / DSM 5306 / Rt17-B1) TaxID=381764 RepID=A7HJC2_FERNB|nr:type II secretion system protein E [Fervidobacterium nodosum Rt17-B1]